MHATTHNPTSPPQAGSIGEMDPVRGFDTASSDGRLDDLSQIIRAYNDVTEKLQVSHESLKAQVTRLQMELASTNVKLQRSKRLAALGEMAAGIAHEIRNPLGAIQLYAGMLVEDLSGYRTGSLDHETMMQTAQKIASGVRGLDAIVNDVLSFAQELSPRPVWLDVGELFDRVIEVCEPMIDNAHVVVDRRDRREPAQSFRVFADPDLIYQSLLNLVRNAVDAMTGPQSVCKSISVSSRPAVLTLDTRQLDQQVLLMIRDTGGGIAESDIDRIFNPFFTTRNTGTGLGLAIVHRIMDAHSGTITVHNDDGAVFELSLPFNVN